MQVNTCKSSGSNQARDQVIVTWRIQADDRSDDGSRPDTTVASAAFVIAVATTIIGWLWIPGPAVYPSLGLLIG